MKQKLLVLGAIIITSACSTSKILKSNRDVNEIRNIHFFKPISKIALIESGNIAKYSDSVSNYNATLIAKAFSSKASLYRINGELTINNANIEARFINESLRILSRIDYEKNVLNIQLPNLIDSVLEKNNTELCLFTFSEGFTRTSSNFYKQMAKGTALGILTLGMIQQNTIQGNSNISLMILDSKNNNIAFYRKSILKDEDPISEETIKNQIYSLFLGYLYKEQW